MRQQGPWRCWESSISVLISERVGVGDDVADKDNISKQVTLPGTAGWLCGQPHRIEA
jgi:hypothetical protein